MGGLGSLFESSTKTLEPKWQTQMRKSMVKSAQPGAIERIQRAGEAYPGELTADMSEQEQQGMGLLSDFLNEANAGGDSALLGQAEQELSRTLGSDYDPSTSEYYKALRNSVLRELRQAKDRLAAATSARDSYWGGGRIAETGELEEGAMNTLATTLGQLSEKERQNRLAVAQGMPSWVSAQQQTELTPVAASQQYGALPRTIEQAGMDAEYQEWMRQLNDLGIPLDVFTGLVTYQPPTAVGESPFQQYAGLAGNLAKAVAMA